MVYDNSNRAIRLRCAGGPDYLARRRPHKPHKRYNLYKRMLPRSIIAGEAYATFHHMRVFYSEKSPHWPMASGLFRNWL